MTGAEALIESLGVNGVRHVFGIPSTHTLEIYRALGRATDIEHITTTHEQGAAFMADGYARATGRPGVCIVTTGPGVTNAATAIAEAYSDSVPVLCITAHIVSEDIGRGRGHSHELRSQENVLAGITDENRLILSPDEVGQAVHDAFRRFRNGRPRPVCLAIPVDVQEATTSVPIPDAPAVAPVLPDADAVERASDLLRAAETPVIVAGGGTQGATEELLAVAERLDAPVVTTLNGKGVVPGGHTLEASLVVYRSVARFLEECDVVLAVGTELSPADLWTGPLRLDGKLIQVDIDPDQIGRNHAVDTAVVGDAGATMAMMLDSLKDQGPREGASRASLARDVAEEEALVMGRSYLPWIRALRKAMPPDSALSLDVAMVAGFGAYPFYDVPGPRTWMNPSGLGTLGYALPAAIGAKIAMPERAVAALVGDGGFMFTMSELMVAAQHRLALPVVIWNDRAFGEIHRLMRERGDEPFATDLHTPDLATLAAAYGAASVRVEEPEDLAVAVETALEGDAPTLVEVPAWT
ncbi:MAG: 5-guanidino-2-oxopentanoate decarboxylase [bacterium]|nr:5-guanidino-2-oxopentanoate decarboxylase [bacterium]